MSRKVRTFAAICAALAATLVASLALLSAQTSITLSQAVAPSAAQPGVHVVTVIGSGFPAGTIAPAAVTVTLTPASGGAAVTTAASTVMVVTGSSRRVSFIVPTAISVAEPTRFAARISGTTATGLKFASSNSAPLTVNPSPKIVSVSPAVVEAGSTATVTITTQYANFPAGPAVASFGSGVSVGGGAEDTPGPATAASTTTVIAQVVASTSAAPGPRPVTVKAGAYQATLPSAFTIEAPDTGLPTISASLSRPANAAGWHNSPVTVTFVCGPAGAPIAFCSPEVTVSQEGAGQIVTGTVRDGSGREASTTVTVNVDVTPPTIAATASAAGWTNGEVTVSFACNDGLSGIAQCPAPATANTEGERAVAGTATDQAGNSATAQALVRIDRTPPTVTATPDRPANAAGWYNAPVTVTFACSDAHSGVDACPAAAVVDQDGAAQNVTRTVTDRAGNSASASAAISLDRVAPTVTITSPANGAVVSASPVAVASTVADALSGIASATCAGTPATVAGSAVGCQVVIQRVQAIAVTVVDRAGNTGSSSVNVSLEGANNGVPIARAGGPYAGQAQKPVSFSGAASSDSDGDALTYTWDFGDGATATGASATHAYAAAGEYTVTLTVADPLGAAHTATTTANIARANRAPTAVPGGPYAADMNTPVLFDASASTDPDGDLLTYAWAFGDGGSGTGERPRRSYVTPGTFTATLTVSDRFGGTHSAPVEVTIREPNRTPTAIAGGPYEGSTGQEVAFTGAASQDPDNDQLAYAWSFGDGGTATGRDVSHAYAAAGSFNVTLTVSDGRGGSHSVTVQAVIAAVNGTPTAHAGGPYTGVLGRKVTFDGAQSSDPDADPLTYAWRFGDGGSRTGAQPQYTYASAGTYEVTLTVSDGRGGTSTASSSVTITAPGSGDNHAPVASAGGPYSGEAGIPVSFSGAASSDADGDPLQYSWNFGDGSTATGVSPKHTFATPGTYQVQLAVADGHGGTHATAAQAVIAPQADRVPPAVQISGPTRVLPGSVVTLTATAADNVAVASVVFALPGSAPTTVTAPPYQRTLTIPAVASPGTKITVNATAADPSGNTRTAAHELTIVAEPDVTAPVVTLSAPPGTAPGAMLRVGASVSDASGVASVRFRIAGVQVPAGSVPYTATYQVPSGASAGTTIPVLVEAFDFAGNRGIAEGTVAVAGAPDVTPPSVQLVAPAKTRAGASLVLRAETTDSDVAAITLLVNGVPVSTVTSAPYQTTFKVPETVLAGMQLLVEARAVDFAGLQATDTASIDVLDTAIGDAVITGEVYDDTSGLAIPGVAVAVTSAEGTGTGLATTDERGRFVVSVPAGDLLVRIARPGWTTVERPVSVASGEALELFDARLTPYAGAATPVSPVLGATLQADGLSATVPAGALDTEVALRLTRVGKQALRGLLPAGWSPVAPFEVVPGDITFGSPVTVRAPRNGVAEGTPLVFATWDTARRGWRMLAAAVAGPATQLLEAVIDSSGHYAWLAADTLPVAPPSPAVGDLVAGVTLAELPTGVETVVNPQPKVLVSQPGVKSDVTGTLTGEGPLSSGTRLWARVVESYHFTSGTEAHPEPFVQDFVFFQHASENNVLLGTFPVTPTLDFEAASLQQGVLTVELFARPGDAGDVDVIDASGGEVTLTTGQRLSVAEGLTSIPLTAQLTALTAAGLGVALPSSLQFVDAVAVALSGGTLSGSAVLSVPRAAGLPETAQLLLARVDTVQGVTKLVFVGLGTVSGDRIVSSAVLPTNNIALDGVRASGRYVFVRPASPVGFVAGRVLAPQGAAFAGAQVSADGSTLISFSRTGGVYVAVTPVGTAKLTALDLQKSDTGFGQVAVGAAGLEAALDLRLIAQPPRVVSISPGEGARNVALSDPITVLFSEPIDPASLAGHVRLVGAQAAPVDIVTTLTTNNTRLTLRPAQPLAGDTLHTLTVEKVKDRSGYELAAAAVVHFTTVDLTAPQPDPAATISASIPDNGTTTITASGGTAGSHDTVMVLNVTRGTSTPVLLDPNGGFVVPVQASLGDALKIKITDRSGNETVIDVPRFSRTNADGSLTAVVTGSGGRVNGPNGVALDIVPGTFPEGTLVTIKSLPEASFPIALTAAQKQVFSYSGGVQLDFGGAEPARYVDVSVPAQPGDRATDQWIVAQALTLQGAPTFNAVDMAGLVAGRVTTASPPCPGVTGQGVYGIYKSNRAVGLNYGEVYHNTVDGGLRLDVEGVNVDLGGGFSFPFPVVAMRQRMPVCMPTLTGNVSIEENVTELAIEPEFITPADRAIQVRNTSVTPAAKYSFPRNILDFAFRVPGHEDDPFEVEVEKVDGTRVTLGSQQIASIATDPGADTVTIRLNMDRLNVTPRAFIVRNRRTTPPVETRFAADVSTVKVSVAAGPNDALEVAVIDADGVGRHVPFVRVGSKYESGNLAVRAVRGAIDPSPQEIAEYNGWPMCSATQPYPCRGDLLDPNHGVIRVTLHDETAGGPELEIPMADIARGAMAFPFQGDRTHRYRLQVFYQDGDVESISIPGYTLVVTSSQTGQVIRRLVAQAPPRGQPQNLGTITNDTRRPILTEGPQRYDNFDPSRPLTFTFSEAIDEASARNLILRDGAGRRVEIASVVLSPDGRTVTFVPKGSLRLGEQYAVDFSDLTDAAGNRVLAAVLRLKTFSPRRLCLNDGGCHVSDTGAVEATLLRGFDTRVTGAVTPRQLEPIEDLGFLRGPDAQGRLRTHLFLTLGGYEAIDYRVASIDVTDPRNAFEVGRDFGGRGKRRQSLIPGLTNFRVAPEHVPGAPSSPHMFANPPQSDPCYVPNQLFTGNIAVMSSFTPDSSYLTFYNVTNPTKPCVLGDKTLTVSPYALSDSNRKNTIHASGFARGVAAIAHDAGISVFTAVGEVGVTATDLARNIPSRFPDARLADPLYAGDVIDLQAFRDRLLIARRDQPKLEVLDVNLAPLASVDLPQRPVHLAVAEALQLDLNGDEQISQSEVRDLAFVATDNCSWAAASGAGQSAGVCSAHLQVVDITTLSSPRLIGNYRLPGAVSSMDVDVARRRLIVGGSVWQQYGGGNALFMIDISTPAEVSAPDADNDGWDDRIVWRQRYATARPNAVAIDHDRGLAYVGLSYTSATGRERGAVDIWALFDDCCDLGVDFTAEADAHETGPDVLDRELRALKAGIKKALDSAQFGEPPAPGRAPVAACGGVTPTRLAILEQGSGACIWSGGCDGTYQPGISDHDYEVFFPQMVPDAAGAPEDAKCVIDRLNAVFADHRPVSFINSLGRPDSMSFDDVTFYPVSLGEMTRARLGIHPPKDAGGSDPAGDLGMGRQQLLLKWLLEGEYVKDIAGYQLKGPDLEWLLQLLRRTPAGGSETGVPLLEGYEWARLMEFNLAKAKAYIRVKGAAQTTSGFHDMFVKQLHDAGKFGLRAALARMVAVAAENKRAIADVSRAFYRSGLGCLDMQPNAGSAAWPAKRCTSFEEYVASAAARSPLFTEAERQLVARFYRVKSDRETILTEQAADAFIAATHAFVQKVKLETYEVYTQFAPSDPRAPLRHSNMSSLVGPDHSPAGFGGLLQKEMTQAKLKLSPRVYNEGFRNADNVLLAMYRGVSTPASGTEVKTLRVSLAGGESRYVRSVGTLGTPFVSVDFADRNLNDVSLLERDSKAYQFVLGGGGPGNAPINQNANFGEPQTVVFTIDLPTRSGDPGHLVQEANRENNYDGFTYYILDRQNTAAPAARPVPLPVSALAINPDPSCFVSPQLRVVSQNIDYAGRTIRLQVQNTSNEQLTNVQVCSDLAGRCVVVGTIGANQVQTIALPFDLPSEAGTFGSNITLYGRTAAGQDVALRWNNSLISSGSPFDVAAYDNTPLNALDHPFSRWTTNRVRQQPDPTPPAPSALAVGDDQPVRGVTTDGTEKALRIRIRNLRPGVTAAIRLLDADTRRVEEGIGRLHLGSTSGVEVSVTPDLSGTVELFYTPPAYFVRPGSSYQNADFNKLERGVRVSVVQEAVGVSHLDIALRRPPVFLVHGLFGTIHVWRDFQPLVPFTPPVGALEEGQSAIGLSQSNAQYYQAREGYDGRFDLFVVGSPHASAGFAVGAANLRADIGLSLQGFLEGYAIGKVDLVAHSMGGVLARKLTNEDPKVRDAVRKLILVNSPQGGSQIADKMTEARDKLPVKVEDPKPFDFLDFDPSKLSSVSPVKLKVEWCSAILNSLGRSGALNVFNGGTDDLRTTMRRPDGTLTEIGRIVLGEWEVPTHHIVDTTTQNDLGFSTEVSALWVGLGLFCNLTPEASTFEKTRLVQIGGEAVKALAPLFKGANATRTLHNRPFGSLESKKVLVDLGKGTLKKGLESVFGIEPPEIVFDTPNDRVVPIWSQLGDGNDDSLPPGPLSLGHPAVTEVFGTTDHQAAKITPLIAPAMCTRVDDAGLVGFDSRVQDYNGDGKPDPTCRVMGLLEADPGSTTFIKTGGQQ